MGRDSRTNKAYNVQTKMVHILEVTTVLLKNWCLSKYPQKSPNVWDNFGRKFVANNFEKSPNVDTLWPNASESFSHVHVTQVVQLLIAALRAC